MTGTAMRRLLRVTPLVLAMFVMLTAPSAHGATKVVEPSGNPVVVHLDPSGRPIPFTITVSGFAPLAQVFVEQCDGTSPQDPRWSPTVDCDLGTQPAGKRASADGTVTFPAADRNYGFRPVRGQSPEQLFNCLAPGDPTPHNGLPSSTACQVRIATNYTTVTADQLFFTLRFAAQPKSSTSSKSSGSSSGLVVALAVAGALVAAALIALGVRHRSRRRPVRR
jgi:hypothetical protein